MPKVLVVDDSVSVRKVVERALAGRQVDVVCAASGGEALEHLEGDAPDVIVCDVVMPDRDGYEICDFVKRHPRLGATPVILMSGIVNDEVRQRAARARSEGVLAKPFAADDLLKRLEDVLGPLPPRAPEPSVPMPSLMPLSAHTLEPMVAPAVEALASPALEPITMSAPDVVIASGPEAVLRPEPLLPAAPEPAILAESGALGRPSTPAPSDGAAAVLAQFTAMDGVQWAVLADREGFVVEATANAGVDADVAAALSACLAESSDGLGRELGRGSLHGIILEYEKGIVVIYGAGAAGLLAVGLSEPAVLGKVRYFGRKVLPELIRTL